MGAIDRLADMYSVIETNLLLKIAHSFQINEEFSGSDIWRIQKLQEMGAFTQEAIEYIARATKNTPEEIWQALKEVQQDRININTLNRIYKNGNIEISPFEIANRKIFNDITEIAYNQLNDTFIDMSKRIEEATKRAYLNIVEQTALATSTGEISYQEAIRESIDRLGNQGLTVLTYSETDTDHIRRYDIEGAVRREVLTSVRQLSTQLDLQLIDEIGAEYIKLSEHLACRPSHFDWQGLIILRSDLVRVTDYGSITGLCGINCKHYIEPYFGKDKPNKMINIEMANGTITQAYANNNEKKIPKNIATENYKLTQKQRYLERIMRKTKRKLAMYKENGDTDAILDCKNKIAEINLRLKKYKRDYAREYTLNGF